jgi:hypothetical protein
MEKPESTVESAEPPATFAECARSQKKRLWRTQR